MSVAELATREGIPEQFLSVILSELRQRGLVRGRRGPDGGCQLNVDPSALNLADVVESLGGPLSDDVRENGEASVPVASATLEVESKRS